MSLIFRAVLPLVACLALAGPTPGRAELPVSPPDNTSAVADWQAVVEAIAHQPTILQKDRASILRALPVTCQAKNTGDIACPPITGIVLISVQSGPLGLIDLRLTPPADCKHLYALLSKRFGPGKLEGGDKCYANWQIGRIVPRAYISVMRGVADPSQINLQFGTDQGDY